MDYFCPDCNAPLTKSLVGYLCHGCGGVHGFEKVSSRNNSHATSTSHSNVAASSSAFRKTPTEPVKQEKKQLKHHLHSFVVPRVTELPGPIDTAHQISQKSSAVKVSAAPALAAAVANDYQAPEVTKAAPEGFRDETPIEDVAGDKNLSLASYAVLTLAAVLVLVVIVLAVMYVSSGIQ